MMSAPIVFKVMALVVLFALVACCVFFYTGPTGTAHAASPATLMDACLVSIL